MITCPHCRSHQSYLLAQLPIYHVMSAPFRVNLTLDCPWTINIRSSEDPKGLQLTCPSCGGLLELPTRVVERPDSFSTKRQIEIYPNKERLMEALL